MSAKRVATPISQVFIATILLLAGLAAAAVMPAKAIAAEQVSVSTWSELYEALQSDGNSIKLTDNVK